MNVCCRCRSENFGDLKFCNFCGARMRAPVPLDVYEGQPPLFAAQAVPVAVEETDPQLAYRYFLKGKHAFAAGDLDGAAEQFRRALEANPGDASIKAFLRRVTECKSQTAAVYAPAPDLPVAGRPHRHTRPSVVARSPLGPKLRALPGGAAAGRTEAATTEHEGPSAPKVEATPATSKKRQAAPRPVVPIWERPTPPSALLSEAPEYDRLNEGLVGFLAIAGLCVAGWLILWV